MKKLNIILLLTFFINSCEKDEDVFGELGKIADLTDSLGVQCLGDIRKVSKYKNLVFVDDFIPDLNDPCYTDQSKLYCANVMEWFHQTKNCPTTYDYSSIKDLNKCVWTVWTGWNFWNSNSESTYRPEAMKIENGHLILTTMKNPNYNPNDPLKCDDMNPIHPHERYRNCPLISGGVDSKYKGEAQTGRSVRYGRVEIRAKYIPKTKTTYPALWMWHNNTGEGYPHVAVDSKTTINGVEQTYTAEFDILEHNSSSQGKYGFHTYHNWAPHELGGGSSYTPKGQIYNLEEYKIYGVEWTPKKISFFVDNCIVHEINDGDQGKAGRRVPLMVSQTASFIIMNMNFAHGINSNSSELFGDQLMIDWVKVYE